MILNEIPRQIGGVDEYRDTDGIRYEIRYLVNDRDIASFLPEIGERADWADPDAYITRVTKTYLADGVWSVLLTAEYLEDGNELATIGICNGGMEGITEQSFDVANVYFPPEWFGCRTARQEDCPPFTDQDKELLPDGKIKYKNTDDQWASPGDFVAINAVPLFFVPDSDQKAQSATPGTYDYKRSPFSGTIPPQWIGQSVSTRVYRCVFHVRKSIRKISGFTGVSGLFGSKCAPDRTGTGIWKARSQRIRSITDSRGQVYTRVERAMIEAPGILTWDPAKNGGIWNW